MLKEKRKTFRLGEIAKSSHTFDLILQLSNKRFSATIFATFFVSADYYYRIVLTFKKFRNHMYEKKITELNPGPVTCIGP